MNDPVFSPPPPFSLADVLAATGALVSADCDLSRSFEAIATLEQAGPRAISAAESSDPAPRLATTRAGACFVMPGREELLSPTTIALVCDSPGQALARLASLLYPDAGRPASMFATRGISPAAFIHPEARLEADVIVDPGVVIGPKAEVGSGTILGANSVIGPGVRIGRNCAIGAQVTIAHALIGNGVSIHSGVRVGQNLGLVSVSVPYGTVTTGIGRVIIQDGVQIGANATIDKGAVSDTVLGEGATVDNLVHVERGQLISRLEVVRQSSPEASPSR